MSWENIKNIFNGGVETPEENKDNENVDKELNKKRIEDRIFELQSKSDFGPDDKDEVEILTKELNSLE